MLAEATPPLLLGPTPRSRSTHYHFEVSRARQARGVLMRLQAARELIENRYYTNLSCEMLARHAGMSKCHFIRMYRDAFGASPYRHLTTVRVSRAIHLIKSTLQPTEAIATAVGFETHATFAKAFKSITGSSIGEYFEVFPGRQVTLPPHSSRMTAPTQNL